MKKSYVVVLLFSTMLFSLNIQGSSQSDFASVIQEEAEIAFKAIDAQMAIQINLSGKQRMLTQKMSKESFLIAQGIDVEENRKNLESSLQLFEKTLHGLEHGDESLGLVKTTEYEIIEQLKKVAALWSEFKPHIQSVIDDKVESNTLNNIAEKNLPLLSEMNKAVKMYELYSGSYLNDSARVINLSGKQRMLTQKMTKELLLVANDVDKKANEANLEKTVDLFEKTLTGLVKGDKELGLPENTDSKILAQLDVVRNHWEAYKPIVKSQKITKESLQEAAKLNLPLLKEMNSAVKMFELASGK
jgi:hypothetical protein